MEAGQAWPGAPGHAVPTPAGLGGLAPPRAHASDDCDMLGCEAPQGKWGIELLADASLAELALDCEPMSTLPAINVPGWCSVLAPNMPSWVARAPAALPEGWSPSLPPVRRARSASRRDAAPAASAASCATPRRGAATAAACRTAALMEVSAAALSQLSTGPAATLANTLHAEEEAECCAGDAAMQDACADSAAPPAKPRLSSGAAGGTCSRRSSGTFLRPSLAPPESSISSPQRHSTIAGAAAGAAVSAPTEPTYLPLPAHFTYPAMPQPAAAVPSAAPSAASLACLQLQAAAWQTELLGQLLSNLVRQEAEVAPQGPQTVPPPAALPPAGGLQLCDFGSATALPPLPSPPTGSAGAGASSSELACGEAEAETAHAGRKPSPAAGACKRKAEAPRYRVKDITREILEREGCFNMTQVDAAHHLGFGSPTSIKAIMKQLGISKWPYRKKATINKMLQNMQRYLRRFCDAEDVEQIMDAVTVAYSALEVYEKCTTGAPPPLAEELRALRQKVYKLKDQEKQGSSDDSMRRCVQQLIEKVRADAEAARSGALAPGGSAASSLEKAAEEEEEEATLM